MPGWSWQSTKRRVKPAIDRVDHAPLLKINALILCTAIFRFAFISLGTPLLADCALLAVPGAADSMPFAAMGGVVLKDPPGQDANSGNSLFSMAQMPEIGLGISAGGDFACLIAGQSDCYPVRNADEFHARWSGAIESDFVLARWKGSLSWSKHPGTEEDFNRKGCPRCERRAMECAAGGVAKKRRIAITVFRFGLAIYNH